MLGLDVRAARATWTVLLIVAGVVLVWMVRRTVLIFILALLLAYLLTPLVDFVDRFRRPRISRNVSLAVVYVLLMAALVTAGALIGGRIFEEAAALARRLPQYLADRDLASRIPVPALLEPYRAQVIEALRAQLEASAGNIIPFLSRMGQYIVSLVGNLVFVILVPVLSFFFFKDGRDVREKLIEQIEDHRRRFVEDIFADVDVLLARYMRALVILSLATFAFYALFLSIIGVEYAVLLSGIACVLEFLPVLGPLLASVTILLVAAFTGYPHLLWIIVFLIVYRMFQDYVLQPYLMSSGVEVPPVAVILGVLAGEQIGGATGMFLSIPVLATLRVVYVRIQKARRGAPVEVNNA